MFWKKDKGTEEITISLDTDNQREAYRVSPDPENPAVLTTDGREIIISDISALGISFRDDETLAGPIIEGSLKLPQAPDSFPVKIEIIGKEPDGKHRCRFIDLEEHLKERIFTYVLVREKQILNGKKKLLRQKILATARKK